MTAWHDLPRLPGYMGEAAYMALPDYAAALHRATGLEAPPFDTLRVARAVGVTVQPVQTYDGNRGLLVPLRDGNYHIIVRADETPGAQRFTVAHELIELGLQIGCPSLVERSYHEPGAGRAKERFCEVGAAEILMPLAHVQRLLPTVGGGIEALPRLASLFGTSLHAMLRRMVDASTAPCAGLIVRENRDQGVASSQTTSWPHTSPYIGQCGYVALYAVRQRIVWWRWLVRGGTRRRAGSGR